VFFVGLHCSLPQLEHREIQRGARQVAEARQDYETVAAYLLMTPNSILSSLWKERKRPSALDKIIEEMNVPE
jgi:chloramphenicol 3-O phosphotransferase